MAEVHRDSKRGRKRERDDGVLSRSSSSSSSAAVVLQAEIEILRGIVCCHERYRIYRHHCFFRHAECVLRRCDKLLLPLGSSSTKKKVSVLLDQIISAGEHALNEAACTRVDTLPVAMALLGVFSRLHFVLSASASPTTKGQSAAAGTVTTTSAGAAAPVRFGVDLRKAVRQPSAVLSVPLHLQESGGSVGSLLDGMNAFHLPRTAATS